MKSVGKEQVQKEQIVEGRALVMATHLLNGKTKWRQENRSEAGAVEYFRNQGRRGLVW